jgi:hypothetical protein
VGAQLASTVPAGGKALQKRASLSHGTAFVVRLRMGVGGDAYLIGLIGLPVDVARMVLLDEH